MNNSGNINPNPNPGQGDMAAATKHAAPIIGNLIDVDVETTTKPTPALHMKTQELQQQQQNEIVQQTSCDKCKSLQSELDIIKAEKLDMERELSALKTKLETNHNELEREVQRRVDLEQRFTEEAKRTTDQIEELIAKSDRDDAKLNELKKKFDLCSRETSSMIENFTTNREILTSQLLELKKENDYLLGKFIGKARDLQSEEINLPQSVEELQFHCLTLNEKLILATLAKERLEETLMRDSNANTITTTTTTSNNTQLN